MSTRKVLGKGTENLKDKKLIIIGLGGLGCTVANLLARLKINLTFVDDDIVDNTNLERQILYYGKDLLKSKSESSKEKLSEFANIISINERLTEKNISKIISRDIDLVIDCTDNIETRLLINKYCKKNKIDWIYSGAVSNIGAIYFIDNKSIDAKLGKKPCFECINSNKDGETSCEIGVLNSLVVMVASMTVNIAVNYLTNGKIEDKMLRINLSDNSVMKINVKKNLNCNICSNETSDKFLKVQRGSQ